MPEEYRDNLDQSAFDPTTVGSAGAAPEPSSPFNRRDAQGRRIKKDGSLWPSPGGRTAAKSGTGSGASKPAGASKEKVRSTLDLSSVVGLFVGAHVMLAERTNIPEIAMEMSEGEQLAQAAQNVLRHYPVETTQKALDWGVAFCTVGMIYGNRFGAYMLRRAAEKRNGVIIPPNVPMRPASPQEASQGFAKPNGSGHAPPPDQTPRFDNDAMVFDGVEDVDQG